MRVTWWMVLAMLTGCDDAWKADITEYDVLVCRYQASCAASVAGLDCDAYEAQYEARPDPCTIYDDYYMEACLGQLRFLVEEVEEEPEACGADMYVGAPACGQAFTSTTNGVCNTLP